MLRGFSVRAVLLLLLAGAAGAQTPAAPSGFVGSNACKTCHADVWFNFYKNAHYKSLASGNESPERTGCEGCHGPAGAHVAARGGKTTIPRAFSLMQPKAVMETCLTCHASNFDKANIRRSEHTQNDVACTGCHSVHHAAAPRFLLARKETELCYGCHANIRAQFEMPSKHRVNEGFMQCSDCHNPHGSFAPANRMADRPRMTEPGLLNEEPCLKCHVDKRGPFVYEHPSVAIEGCEACHYPHGSTNARLLRRPVTATLCLECHNGSGFGVRNAGVDLQSGTHNLLDPKFQKCTTCHVRIHGSNSNVYFLR